MRYAAKVRAAWARGWAWLWLDCRRAAQLQARPLDERLSLSARWRLRLHLLLCGWCRRYGAQLRRFRTESRPPSALSPDVPPTPLPAAARRRLLRRLRHKRRNGV